MQINDGGYSPTPVRPSPPKVDPPRTPPAPPADVHVTDPPGQQLFSRPPVPPTPPPPPPAVPVSASDARARVYDATLEAATPPVLHRLPPEARAAVLGHAAEQAERAVAAFDKLYDAANPVSARELRHMPPEDAAEIRQQAVAQAWQAYQVLTVDGPLVAPASASVVVDRAVDQAQALFEQSARFSPELQDAVVEQIVAGTEGLETRIADETSRVLADHFPTLRDFYGEQGRRFTEMLRDGVRAAAQGATAPSDALAKMNRLQERYEAMRTDVTVVSGFDGVDAGLEAFGITLGTDGTGTPWTDAMREQVLAQAVRIENAFRAADPDGLLTRFGAGEAFDAIFASRGDITLNTIPERRGCNWDTAPVISAGAITCSSELIEYRTFSSDQTWDGMANSRQYHLAHEFGHALNASIAAAYRGLDETDRSPYQVIDDAAEGLPSPSQRDWDDPAWGLPTRDVQGTPVRSPYQQNATASNGEYFADTFSNWANGSLLDNEAGRALQSWMDRRAPEWVRARLEASGLLEAPPATAGR
jgi:hypothetical protein